MLIGIQKKLKMARKPCCLYLLLASTSLVSRGHRVLIRTNAGLGSGFTDADYQSRS